MLKRFAALILSVLFSVLFFAGCSDNNNSEVVGRWTPVTATINGTTVQYSSLEVEEGSFELVFESNGKCVSTIGGVSTEGKYVFNKTSVDVEMGTVTRKLDFDGENLTIDLEGTKFTFMKIEEK